MFYGLTVFGKFQIVGNGQKNKNTNYNETDSETTTLNCVHIQKQCVLKKIIRKNMF